MENSDEKRTIESIETRKISNSLKFTTVILILFFAFVPLVEFVNGFDYNQSFSPTFYTCLVGWEEVFQLEPLQFKPLPPLN